MLIGVTLVFLIMFNMLVAKYSNKAHAKLLMIATSVNEARTMAIDKARQTWVLLQFKILH